MKQTPRILNSYTQDGFPCRLITVDGKTMNMSEWRKYLGCSLRTVYRYLNKGEEEFANFVRKRLNAVKKDTASH